MAPNRNLDLGRQVNVTPTAPASPNSGDPCVLGQLPGVALRTVGSDGKTTIDTMGVYNLSVKGINNVTNTAINAGDILFYHAGATPVLDVTSTGVRFGYALDPVGSGATATIRVRLGY